MGLEGEALKEEKVIRLCRKAVLAPYRLLGGEFVALIGATAGIRAYHRSTGQTLPEAPHTDLQLGRDRVRQAVVHRFCLSFLFISIVYLRCKCVE